MKKTSLGLLCSCFLLLTPSLTAIPAETTHSAHCNNPLELLNGEHQDHRLWADISIALNKLMYDTAQLFRHGHSGDEALIQRLLDNLMSNFSDDLTSFTVISPTIIELHNKDELRQFYYNDATRTYAGYVLHQLSNVLVKNSTDNTQIGKPTAFMKAFQVEYARVNAPLLNDPTATLPTNILVAGNYEFQWVLEQGKWKVLTLRIIDDRIYLLEPLVLFQRTYSGETTWAPNQLIQQSASLTITSRFSGSLQSLLNNQP